MSTPSVYDVEIVHVRLDPMRHDVRHRGYLWYVDLDDVDGLPVRFESCRADVDTFLAEHGVDLRGGRITMLASARSLGYVFNPLTLYWCHDRAGQLACVVAEVHNTYRQQHRYLLRPDDAGRAEVPKDFYVSPFYPVDGHYRMRLPEPGEQVSLTIALHRPGERPFTATVRGVRRPSTRRARWRYPLEPWRVRALITRHGITLWRKGLHVQARPDSTTVAARLAALVRTATGLELPVRIRAWDGSTAGPPDGPTLVIRSRRALRRLLWAPGELGLARAYVTGELDVEGDLAQGLRRAWALARTRPAATTALSRGAWLRAAVGAARLGAIGPAPTPPESEARLTGGLHTRGRDRAAIAHHYDLSNEFYELLLDESMAYSSAYFTSAGQSLADAQRAKLDLVCRKLHLRAGMQLLDVGCGWGSLLVHAAANYGVHATGVTLSAQQRDFVAKRVADRGLGELVEVRLQDYRELDSARGRYDAVVSIEMGEHVGESQYPHYAAVLFGALRGGGRLVLQQMSRRAGTAPGGGAFIESYIAPDMHMRPMSQTVRHLEDAGFEVRHVQAMREHYVRTVHAWIETFEANRAAFVALQGEEVARVWQLYLAGGALAFEEGRMGVDQFVAVRP